MTAKAAAVPKAAAPRKRPTAAEKIAAQDAELEALRRQLAAQTVANAAPLPPSAAAPFNGTNGASSANGHAPAAIPEILKFTTDEDEPGVRVPLFSINGKEYTIPGRPDLTVGLRAYRIAASAPSAEIGEARALNFILTEMLGDDGYDALLSYRKITPAQFAKVVEICRGLTLGQLEDPKGFSGSA